MEPPPLPRSIVPQRPDLLRLYSAFMRDYVEPSVDLSDGDGNPVDLTDMTGQPGGDKVKELDIDNEDQMELVQSFIDGYKTFHGKHIAYNTMELRAICRNWRAAVAAAAAAAASEASS